MPAPHDKSIIAVFDLDGTITHRDTYLAFLIMVLLRRPQRWVLLPWLAVAVVLHKVGARSNTWLKETFLKNIVGGVFQPTLALWSKKFAQKICRNGLNPGVIPVLKQHQTAGHKRILATASFDFYVHYIATHLEFDQWVSTQAEIDPSGMLTGRIQGQNCFGVAKVEALEQLLEMPLENLTIIAYSDHHADLPLFKKAKHCVAVNPSSTLEKYATQQNSPLSIKIVDWYATKEKQGW